MPESVIHAVLGRFESHAPAVTTIKEEAAYGSDQTQHTRYGRRSDSDVRSTAPVGSADWARRQCHVFLRKRPRSHPLRGGRVRLPVVTDRRRGVEFAEL